MGDWCVVVWEEGWHGVVSEGLSWAEAAERAVEVQERNPGMCAQVMTREQVALADLE